MDGSSSFAGTSRIKFAGLDNHLSTFPACTPEQHHCHGISSAGQSARELPLANFTSWPVAAALIGILGDQENGFDRDWALSALLAGWGRGHPEVKPAIDALADAADEDLGDLAALLPEIMIDKSAARERLLRMGTRAEVRRDLLAIGLEACGCDAADNEAVAAVLAFP